MAKSNFVIQRRREHWRELLRRWQGSGLSQAAFCRRHNIPTWKLAWWRKHLPAEDVGYRPERSLAKPDRSRSNRRRIGRSVGPIAPFIPVRIVSPTEGSVRLELTLKSGRRLGFSADVNTSSLSAIVAALESLPC